MAEARNRQELEIRPRTSLEPLELLAHWLMTFSQLYHVEIGEWAALAYRESLREFTSTEIDRGCREAIRVCVFIPKPAEIIRAIRETRPVNHISQSQDPPMTKEEAMEFLRTVKESAGPVLDATPFHEHVIEITDEVRQRIESQKKELREKFPEHFQDTKIEPRD